jgi:hypothetical protein
VAAPAARSAGPHKACLKTCLVCLDGELEEGQGVSCAHGHFFCDGCFSQHVETEAGLVDANPDLLRERGGRVLCPIERHEPAFSAQQVVAHVTAEAFELYDRARQAVLQQAEFEKAQAQLEEELRKRASAGGGAGAPSAAVLAKQMQQLMPNAVQCGRCGVGPVDHVSCSDLTAHHGQRVGAGRISNACQGCGWFSPNVRDWPKWDGRVAGSAA